MENFKFRNLCQADDQNIDSFLTELLMKVIVYMNLVNIVKKE